MILLHFDVDVVDSGQWPLGNYPSYGGIEFSAIMKAVQTALVDEAVDGLVVPEVNSNNDPTGAMLEGLVKAPVEGLSERKKLVSEAHAT